MYLTSAEVKRDLGRLLKEVREDGLRVHIRHYKTDSAVLVPRRWYDEVTELVGDLAEP